MDTTQRATTTPRNPNVPDGLACRIDDTALTLDALADRVEVLGRAHVGVRMQDAFHSARRIAEDAEASGKPATAGQVLEPLARALFYDPIGTALDILADELGETARNLRGAATEAGVSLSKSALDTLPK